MLSPVLGPHNTHRHSLPIFYFVVLHSMIAWWYLARKVKGRGKIRRRLNKLRREKKRIDIVRKMGKISMEEYVYCICTTLDYNAFLSFVYNRVRK